MSVRTGFIARGFIPFSTHVVSFGYGGVFDDLYPLPPEAAPELVPGTFGPAPRWARTLRAPCFSTEGPALVEVVEPVPRVAGETLDGPAVVVEGSEGAGEAPPAVPAVGASTSTGPAQELELAVEGDQAEAVPGVVATVPGAPAPLPGKQG